MNIFQHKTLALFAPVLILVGCEGPAEPETAERPGEPVPFAATVAEGEIAIGPRVYACGQWMEDEIPATGDDLYLDLIAPWSPDDLSWFTDRGAEVLHRFEAGEVLDGRGAQIRIRLPRERMDEWRGGPGAGPVNHVLGVVNRQRHDVVFRGKYLGDEDVLRDAVTEAGGILVGRLDRSWGPLYTIILPDDEMKDFHATSPGADFEYTNHRSVFCL